MKKLWFLSLTLMSLTLLSCSNDEESVSDEFEDKDELVEFGKDFASIHNDCLGYIYEEILEQSNSNTRSVTLGTSDFRRTVVSLTNRYISENCKSTRSDVHEVEVGLYDMSIEDIKKNMSEKEFDYVNFVLDGNVDTEKLLYDISNDNDLQMINKQALICFVTTFEASSMYWQDNLDSWLSVLGVTKTRGTHFSWKKAAVSDSFWAYQGLLFSGLNIFVGGGAAAAGSVLGGLG